MAIKLTPESFLNVVRQSNLVTADVLKRVISELREEGAAVDNARAISDALVERNLLTRWQADKLLQGKHKGFFLGKYRLLKLLGKGGMSSVYLAEHVLMRRQCAIKVLPTKRVNDTSYLGRFHREAQAVASLDHPNIIKAYDVDKEMEKDAEIHFLVMEFVDGRSLQEIVQQDGPLSYPMAADFIRQSAEGLGHAHEAGMVHRDIKPGNLLIDRNNVVKLLDMGLARFFHEGDEESLTVAHDEKVLGTADYLAPEQALDSHSVDARADLYSLGCTFYFLLTGHPPFTEGTLAQRLMSHQTKQPPSVTEERPDIPRDLLSILEKMMAKKREVRYQTAADITRDLGEWLKEHGSEESHKVPSSQSGKTPGGNGQNAISPEKRSSVVVKPAVPIAKPVPKEPAPATVAEPAESENDPGLELSEFLANLGTSESLHSDSSVTTGSRKGSSVADRSTELSSGSGKKPAPQIPPEASPAPAHIPKAGPLPAMPVGKPSAPAVPAKPVATAKAVASAPPPIPKPAAEASTALVEEPEFPPFENEFSIDTPPHLPDLTVADTISKPVLRAPRSAKAWKDRLKDKRVLTGLGALLVLLLGLAVYWFVTNWVTSEDGLGIENVPPNDSRLIGEPILVGPDGHFQTIKGALDYVVEYYNPLNATDPQVIELAAGEVFAEGIHLENPSRTEFHDKVRILTDAQNPATLKPPGTDPVIRLAKGINYLEIANLKIDADGQNVAIELQGKLEGTQLRGLTITGYKTLGIKAESIFGSPKTFEAESAVVIENCTFKSASPSATGILLENTGSFVEGNPLEEIVVRGCRFLGPMEAGLEVKNGVTSLLVISNIFAGDGSGVGVKWTGSRGFNRVLLGNNTFHNLSQGVTIEGTIPFLADSGMHRNLFAEIKQQEAALLQGDAAAFANSHLKGAALEANVTTGGKTPPGDKQELNIFAGKNSKTDAKIAFASTERDNKTFLAPSPADSLPMPGDAETRIRALAVKLPPYIGAVEP